MGDEAALGLDRSAHEHSRIAGPIVAAALIFFVQPLLWFTPPTPLRKVHLPVGPIVRDVVSDALTFCSIYAASLFGWDTQELAVFGICVLGSAAGGSGRAMMSCIAPKEHLGQWFGSMALAGNAVAFTGPALAALETYLTDSERYGLMVAPFIVGLGFILMLRVRSDWAHITADRQTKAAV